MTLSKWYDNTINEVFDSETFILGEDLHDRERIMTEENCGY
jgi:hypothetical protein